ncbi:TIP41-like protein [Leptotrombidium deliense]|uniref:TIP41-like protein n=1 Tax=Leptotrombidium deliense TaxID=299467 RepID=A0A443SQB7_9ACAR|nr:TIP41-like protein [Leptotrombidium deliense]
MSAAVNCIHFDGIAQESFTHKQWNFISRKSHILQSICATDCQQNDKEEKCLFCSFQSSLELPNFPDMTFAKNLLRIEHGRGFGFEFTCLSALKAVEKCEDPLKVEVSEAWMEARNECRFARLIKKPYNWTYSTLYPGDLFANENNETFTVEKSIERIDLDKLRQKEEIIFYDDINLFEDELGDNGVAKCSVKIRVMKERFLVLLRYFLRVDNVIVKINDTRYYHEFGSNYLLREQTTREANLKTAQIPAHALLDPVELCNYIPLSKLYNEKLTFSSD